MYNIYHQNGVVIRPNVIAEGDTATVMYKGILHNKGADSVYMHIGYSEDWKDAKDIKMSRTDEGFEAHLPITSREQLKIAFKDSANHWDNNSGRNYSFEVQNRFVSIDTR
ncbi:MAG: carbohydrate-binding protein [Clostridia bacterium]|nr:carbohydrate-binding protein [Clostridia bacterium]